MAAQYHSLFTTQGLALLREAIQNGTKIGITHMAYGDGNGIVPTPNADFTKLVKEVYRTPLNRLSPSKENSNWLEADGVIPSAVGGFNIREVGLYAGNVLVAYANYPATYKPSSDQGTAQIKTIRIVLQIDNTANFELKIDASVVMATIQAVEDAKIEVIQFTEDEFKKRIRHVKTINELLEINDMHDGDTVKVKGYNSATNFALLNPFKGGGTFVYNSTLASTNNLVTIISGWVRQNVEKITPEMAGAFVDGVTNDTFAFDRIFAISETVDLLEATYLANITVTKTFEIVGKGSNKSIIKAFDKNKPVIMNLNNDGTWKYSLVEKIGLFGAGNKEGIGFSFGDFNTFTSDAHLVGRVKFKDIYTYNFDKHICKCYGNIGNTYDNVSMGKGNYGFYSRGSQITNNNNGMMHAGCELVLGGHITAMDKMGALVIDSTGGTGQWTFINTIFEANAGGSIYFDVNVPYKTYWSPVILQNVWFEANATSATVDIDAVEGGIRTIVPINGFDQRGGIYPSTIFLQQLLSVGTDSTLGTVNFWGNERAALNLVAGKFGIDDWTDITFSSEADKAVKGATIRSTKFTSSSGRTLELTSGHGLGIYLGENGKSIFGYTGNTGLGFSEDFCTTLAGYENAPEGQKTHKIKSGFGASIDFYQAAADGANTAQTVIKVPKNSVTSRSINAGGTVNTSGADYAEYMRKSDNCGEIEKGEVIGVNKNGELTKIFDESISFVVKSTNPSFVGGDIFFTDEEPERYTLPYKIWLSNLEALSAINLKKERTESNDEYSNRVAKHEQEIITLKKQEPKNGQTIDWLEWFNRLEDQRKKHDRVAFSGQVPINVEASPGDYIIAIKNDYGSIGTRAQKQITFEESLTCVGKVWKIIENKPNIIVFNN